VRFNTPLRYPGGKGKLTGYFEEIVKANGLEGGTYIEPFAGGAGTAINLLSSGVAGDVVINDADPSIFAFWKAITEHTEPFLERLDSIEISVDEWMRQREIQERKNTAGLFELGFSTFYLNRTNRSGIIGGGLIGGQKQDGKYRMDARFNKKDLCGRIESIGKMTDSIRVTGLDAKYFLEHTLKEYDRDSTLVYIDPPYFNKGSLLYMNYYTGKDHCELADTVRSLDHDWVLSYDDAPEIRHLYSWCEPVKFNVSYSSYIAAVGREIFFHSDGLIRPEVDRKIGTLSPATYVAGTYQGDSHMNEITRIPCKGNVLDIAEVDTFIKCNIDDKRNAMGAFTDAVDGARSED